MFVEIAHSFKQGAVEGYTTHMLVDTGSSVTLLHENVWKAAVRGQKQLSPAKYPVMAVNGESLVLSGQGDVLLKVGEHVGVHSVLVVKEMTQECLLGTDFLERHNCVIDLGQRTLTIAGHVTPVPLFSGDCACTCHVLVKETVVIPAYHQVQLPVDLASDEDFPGHVGLFEPKTDFAEDHGGVMVAHSVSPTYGGKTTIQLINPTPVPVTRYSQEKIGKLSFLQEADTVRLVEPSLDKKPKVRSEEAIRKTIDEMASKVQGLTVGEHTKFRSLLREFADVISVGDGDLGRTRVLRHKINTGDALPIHQQARRLPFHQRDMVQKMIKGMLEQGIIEPADGSWSSPIVLAKKKDGSFRIDDTLDTLAGAQWFSTIDLASGYWQVEMDPSDKEKTTFVTPFGLHQFRVMPFGLTNAPSTFQRLMGLVLAGLSWSTCLVYLDDIIVFSQTVEEHFTRLADVLRRLNEAGLKLKPSKCQLFRKSVQYLGYVVSEKGIEIDPAKTSCFDRTVVGDTDASQEGIGAVLAHEGHEQVIAYASRVLSKAEKQYCATRREMLALNFKDPQGQIARWLEILAEYDFTIQHRPGLKHSNADALSRLPCKQCGRQDSEATAAPSEMKKEESNDVTNSVTEAFQAMSSWVPVLPFFDQKREQQSDPDLTQVTAWISSHLMLQDGVLYRRWEDVPGKGLNKHLQFVLPKALVKTILQECHDSPSGSHLGMTKTLEKIRSRFYWPGQRKDVEDWCKGCEMCASRKSPSTKRRAPLQSDLTGCPLQRVAMDILGPLPLTDRGNKYVLVVGDYFTKWVEAYAMPNMEAGTVAELFVSRFVCQFGVPDVLHTDQGRNFESALLKEVCQLLGVVKTRTTPYHPQSDGLVERFNRTLLNLLSMAASENERDWDLHIPMVMMAYRTSVQESTGCTPFYLMFGLEGRLPADVMFRLPSSPMQVNKYAQDMRFRMEQAYQLVRDRLQLQQRRQKALYDRTTNGSLYAIGDHVWLHCPAVPKGKSAKLHRYWQGPYKVIDVLGKVLFKIQHRDHPRKKCVVHFDRLKPYVHSSKRDEEQEVLPPQHSSNGEQEDDVEIEIVPGKRPDQRRNDPVDHEEVPVEPQEVVVEEDREVEQQQAAPGEEIVGDMKK
eukprot:Em0025g110a